MQDKEEPPKDVMWNYNISWIAWIKYRERNIFRLIFGSDREKLSRFNTDILKEIHTLKAMVLDITQCSNMQAVKFNTEYVSFINS